MRPTIVALLALLLATPLAAAPLAPHLSTMASLAGDATLAALQADSGAHASKVTLAGVHDASMVVSAVLGGELGRESSC